MKSIKGIFIGLGLLALAGNLQAQALVQSSDTQVSAQPDSIAAITAEAEGLTQVDPTTLPLWASCWWTVYPDGRPVPMPCPPLDLSVPIYEIASGIYLVDESGGAVNVSLPRTGAMQSATTSAVTAAVEREGNAIADLIEQVQETQYEQEMAMSFGIEMRSSEEESGGMNTPIFLVSDPDSLWLEITNVSNGYAYANLHMATNQVYAIWATTNLLTSWKVETEVWPTNSSCMPFTVLTQNRQNLFLRAQDWTGVTHGGNTAPDWWLWLYFGTTALSDTNLDGQGNTLLSDYQNSRDPNIISFSLSATNQYFKSMSASVIANVTAGMPSFFAVLVDDTNFNNAVWNAYTSSNLAVNLGLYEGWHDVQVGLRGFSTNARQTWQWKHLNLAFPPLLVITNPVGSVVSQPIIQIYGYCQESLASINYDISNALGVITSQPSAIIDRYYDRNVFRFTTNYFECLDVQLTNGLNTITIHAIDFAGNVTTSNFNFTVDYSSKTNAPAVQITWPQNGTQISGSNFTCRGVIDDPTATMTTRVILANGTTNVYTATVERNGKFWIENLPIGSGTNIFSITVQDVVGNASIINISVVKSSLAMTINPVSDTSQLWQPTVYLTGTISGTNAAVWVNGVKGHNNGNGTWSANKVPVNSGGTASFVATTYDITEQQPDGSYGN